MNIEIYREQLTIDLYKRKLTDKEYINRLTREIGPINADTLEIYYNMINNKTVLNHIDEIMEYVKTHQK